MAEPDMKMILTAVNGELQKLHSEMKSINDRISNIENKLDLFSTPATPKKYIDNKKVLIQFLEAIKDKLPLELPAKEWSNNIIHYCKENDIKVEFNPVIIGNLFKKVGDEILEIGFEIKQKRKSQGSFISINYNE